MRKIIISVLLILVMAVGSFSFSGHTNNTVAVSALSEIINEYEQNEKIAVL